MLLALTSAKRQSDLHALDLAFMQFLPEGVGRGENDIKDSLVLRMLCMCTWLS